MQARDIMTHDVITIHPQASVQDAARHLSDYHISGMPVVDEDSQVIGIVTEADILTRSGATVEKIMTRRVVSVQEDTPTDEIAQILSSKHIKRVPVMAGDRLLGMVTRADIIRMMVSRWVCQVCGSIHLGQMPHACESCGVGSIYLDRDLAPRIEMTSRD
ncbi:MAG TPA: CBS domain-containing protein [Ktedonobacterales bacterium]|nr:CBS domain-containing protein [Ktedonobacterales bacterium]